jgi:hypothetical protein
MIYYVRLENNRVVEKTTQNMSEEQGWLLVSNSEVLQNRIVFWDENTEQLRGATEEELLTEQQQSDQVIAGITVRNQRNVLLEASDNFALVDRWNTFTPTQQQAISNYRQNLRDLTSQPGFPTEVVWPELNLNGNT